MSNGNKETMNKKGIRDEWKIYWIEDEDVLNVHRFGQ